MKTFSGARRNSSKSLNATHLLFHHLWKHLFLFHHNETMFILILSGAVPRALSVEPLPSRSLCASWAISDHLRSLRGVRLEVLFVLFATLPEFLLCFMTKGLLSLSGSREWIENGRTRAFPGDVLPAKSTGGGVDQGRKPGKNILLVMVGNGRVWQQQIQWW